VISITILITLAQRSGGRPGPYRAGVVEDERPFRFEIHLADG
jgi:hypothetical protein